MDDLHKLHQIITWIWSIEKKYPTFPIPEEGWTEIIEGRDRLVSDLGLSQESYPRRLLKVWSDLKEKCHGEAASLMNV